MSLYARDDVGNESRASFDYRVFPKRFRESRITLNDRFLQKVVPEILYNSPELEVEDSSDLLASYLRINGDLRRQNNARIASMAEAHDVALAPHCPLGPISFAAALQVDFVSLNAFIQETSLGIHYNEGADLLDYVVDPNVFDVHDGYVELLTAPGLGIEVDEARVREMAKRGHDWRNPIWRNLDGSITEW